MRMKLAIAAAGVALMIAAVPVVGHHAFSAEFDATRPLKIEGPVVKVEWINPHAWIHIEVTKEEGSKEVWSIEGGTPNTLFRRGFKKDSLMLGTDIVVDGYQAKDGSNKMNGRNLTLPNGDSLFVIVYRSGLTKGTGVLSGARRIDVTMSITRIPL